MKIFLTGATGFLGNEVLKSLLSRGHEVTALVRSPERSGEFPAHCQVVRGTIENVESYREILPGHDVFVHIAALVKMWVKDSKQFERVNVTALDQAIQAAAESGIKKFIHTSSFIALGPSNGHPLKEEDARRTDHFHNAYERTKYLGDQVARKYVSLGYPLYIVYPGIIYGPGNMTYGNIVAKNVIPFLNGKMPFGLALQAWSYVYVQDVVRAFMKLIESEPPSRRYILGGDNQNGADFYRILHEVSGKRPPVLNIPMSLAAVAGYGEYLLAVLFGREPSLMTHEVVQIYKHAWAYDSSLAVKELNYQITPLKQGLREMVEWLKSAGYVK